VALQEIVVLIAALNEKRNLELPLPRLPKIVAGRKISVLLIDDGGSDGTKEMPLPENVKMISIPKKSGQGAALRLGFNMALSDGAKFIVTMDADGQNQPEEIEILLAPLISDLADFVIGSRIIGQFEQDDPFRLLGVKVYSYILNILLSIRITDCSSGFRAMNKKVLEGIINELSQKQYQTAEVIMEVANKGFRITEVPVTLKKRLYGHSKKGPNILFGLCFARTILNTWYRQQKKKRKIA